jgi:hypothetical protein
MEGGPAMNPDLPQTLPCPRLGLPGAALKSGLCSYPSERMDGIHGTYWRCFHHHVTHWHIPGVGVVQVPELEVTAP